MNNKIDIEEDIKILKDKELYWNYAEKRVLQAIENILADRERLEKENEEYKNQLDLDYVEENYIRKIDVNKAINEARETMDKANKYDRLMNKIKERIKSVEKCYEDLIKPYYDKEADIINVSFMSKREKEEFINKRNCILVQKHCYKEILKLLNIENLPF